MRKARVATEVVRFRAHEEEVALWKQGALLSGKSLSEFGRQALTDASMYEMAVDKERRESPW